MMKLNITGYTSSWGGANLAYKFPSVYTVSRGRQNTYLAHVALLIANSVSGLVSHNWYGNGNFFDLLRTTIASHVSMRPEGLKNVVSYISLAAVEVQ